MAPAVLARFKARSTLDVRPGLGHDRHPARFEALAERIPRAAAPLPGRILAKAAQRRQRAGRRDADGRPGWQRFRIISTKEIRS